MVRGIFVPFMRCWWGLRIADADRIPAEGPAILTPNHKSFFDSFFLAAATKRHLRFMGKSELFEGRLGKTFVRLGAFPVRRGEADAEALETARVILDQGGLLSLFPEGTRVRDPEGLGTPKRGAVRLALESGAPLVPAAITGTEKLFFHGRPPPDDRAPVVRRADPGRARSRQRPRRRRASLRRALAGGRGPVRAPARPSRAGRGRARRARHRRRRGGQAQAGSPQAEVAPVSRGTGRYRSMV